MVSPQTGTSTAGAARRTGGSGRDRLRASGIRRSALSALAGLVSSPTSPTWRRGPRRRAHCAATDACCASEVAAAMPSETGARPTRARRSWWRVSPTPTGWCAVPDVSRGVWMAPGYLENFVQAIFDNLDGQQGKTLVLGGDASSVLSNSGSYTAGRIRFATALPSSTPH